MEGAGLNTKAAFLQASSVPEGKDLARTQASRRALESCPLQLLVDRESREFLNDPLGAGDRFSPYNLSAGPSRIKTENWTKKLGRLPAVLALGSDAARQGAGRKSGSRRGKNHARPYLEGPLKTGPLPFPQNRRPEDTNGRATGRFCRRLSGAMTLSARRPMKPPAFRPASFSE